MKNRTASHFQLLILASMFLAIGIFTTEGEYNNDNKVTSDIIIIIIIYLDLGPPVPVGTLGDEVPPSGTVVGNHHGFFTIVGDTHHPKVLS